MLKRPPVVFGEKRRSFWSACKSGIALTILPIWLVSMSYCGLTSLFPCTCKHESSHEMACHRHSSEDPDSNAHSSQNIPTSKNEVCCKAIKTVVLSESNIVVQQRSLSVLLWILSDNKLLYASELNRPGKLLVHDHGPPNPPLILFSLRHSHQENAPPSFV